MIFDRFAESRKRPPLLFRPRIKCHVNCSRTRSAPLKDAHVSAIQFTQTVTYGLPWPRSGALLLNVTCQDISIYYGCKFPFCISLAKALHHGLCVHRPVGCMAVHLDTSPLSVLRPLAENEVQKPVCNPLRRFFRLRPQLFFVLIVGCRKVPADVDTHCPQSQVKDL